MIPCMKCRHFKQIKDRPKSEEGAQHSSLLSFSSDEVINVAAQCAGIFTAQRRMKAPGNGKCYENKKEILDTTPGIAFLHSSFRSPVSPSKKKFKEKMRQCKPSVPGEKIKMKKDSLHRGSRKEVGLSQIRSRALRKGNVEVNTESHVDDGKERKMKVGGVLPRKKEESFDDVATELSSLHCKGDVFFPLAGSSAFRIPSRFNNFSCSPDPVYVKSNISFPSRRVATLSDNSGRPSLNQRFSSKRSLHARQRCIPGESKCKQIFHFDSTRNVRGRFLRRPPRKGLPCLVPPEGQKEHLSHLPVDNAYEACPSFSCFIVCDEKLNTGIELQTLSGAKPSQSASLDLASHSRKHHSGVAASGAHFVQRDVHHTSSSVQRREGKKRIPLRFPSLFHHHSKEGYSSQCSVRTGIDETSNGLSKPVWEGSQMPSPSSSPTSPRVFLPSFETRIENPYNARKTRLKVEKKATPFCQSSCGVIALKSLTTRKELKDYLSSYQDKNSVNSYRAYLMNVYLNERAECAARSVL